MTALIPIPEAIRQFKYPVKMLVLSHSSRSLFRSCARKFEFRQMYGDTGTREEAYAAECGVALHAGFQTYLVTRDEQKAIIAFAMKFPYALEMQEKNAYRSLEACYATLMAMINSDLVQRYELVQINTRMGVKDAIEVPFALQITGTPTNGIPVYYVGFIDCILYDPVENVYFVVDVKTTRINVSNYSARYEFDEQVVPYGIILEHALGKPIDEIKVAYISTYIDLMEPKVTLYSFNKTQQHITDWMEGLCDDIERMGKYIEKKWWPRATDGNVCFSFNRPCWFIDYCSYRDPAVLKQVIAGEVRENLFHDGQEPWIMAELPFVGRAA